MNCVCARWLSRVAAHIGLTRSCRPCRPVQEVRRATRLTAVRVEGTVYVLWTVPTGASVALHGGWLVTDPAAPETQRYHLDPAHLIRPMSMGTAGQGISPATDVAAAASANSFLAVAQQADKSLAWLLFDNPRQSALGPDAR